MGVSTGWGGGARLVSIVGRRAALRLLGWSSPIAAEEGLLIGLLDAVAAEEGGALAEARGFLSGVLEQDSRGVAKLGWIWILFPLSSRILGFSVREQVGRVREMCFGRIW